jgi:hypothetical protein
MNFLNPHKYWIASLIVAALLIVLSEPMLNLLQDEAQKHLSDLRSQRAKTEQSLQQLENDIAETKKLSGQMGAAEVEKSLAPVDRLQAADVIEKQAAAARLTHVTYTLSPEQKVKITRADAGPQELALSTITIKADAPLDTDAYAFVGRLRGVLPGRLRPQALTLERIGAPDAAPAADNLHLTAVFEWLSNGAAKEKATEGR